MNRTLETSRRGFLIKSVALGAGLSIGFDFSVFASGAKISSHALSKPEIGVWLSIKPNNDVVIRVVKSEMGQGTITGLCQMVAEELDCDWNNVSYEYPTPGQSYRRNQPWGSFLTGGSLGIRGSEPYVRRGGAAARAMLIQAAANKWNLPPDECTASNGSITHKPTGRKTTFGKVAEDASRLEIPQNIVLKDPKDWKLIGKSVSRIDDMAGKVTGSQIYGIDLNLPGMLVATINECPVFGGGLKSFDPTEALKVRGVKKVVDVNGTAVAVIADTFWHAKSAIEMVKIVWDYGPNAGVTSDSIKKTLEEGLSAKFAFVRNKRGSVDNIIDKSQASIESTYFYPFLSHATLEPMNATVKWTSDRCEAWVPTQDAEYSLSVLMGASGFSAEKCDVYKVNMGGAFGRRGLHQDYLKQTVHIAKQIPGIPVKLIWTREEDMTQGCYHPVMMGKLKATFDQKKKLQGVHMRLSGQSILASINPSTLDKYEGLDPEVFQGLDPDGEHAFTYDFPNLLIDYAMRNTHVTPGFRRGVNVNQNCIFIETFIDEIADYAEVDPLLFRLQYLKKQPRAANLLKVVGSTIGWDVPPKPGIFRGVAQMYSYGSYAAAACELSISNGSEVKINRLVGAIDPGCVVNPAQVKRQVSGSFLYGLSALFEEEITIKDGRVEQKNFNEFNSLRLGQMPDVETFIIEGDRSKWGGVGEPAIAVAAPAVLNALNRATGKRFRSVPLKNSGISLI